MTPRLAKVSTDLDKTVSDLNMARSELGTLIARNHDEIDVLRRQGERDYIEFTITGKNQPQKVGNVTVVLKGVNEKKNRSNIVYTVEDKSYEAKNANINTPLFFYISGTHQPEELVINKVGKNTISGYLSVPKANATARDCGCCHQVGPLNSTIRFIDAAEGLYLPPFLFSVLEFPIQFLFRLEDPLALFQYCRFLCHRRFNPSFRQASDRFS